MSVPYSETLGSSLSKHGDLPEHQRTVLIECPYPSSPAYFQREEGSAAAFSWEAAVLI